MKSILSAEGKKAVNSPSKTAVQAKRKRKLFDEEERLRRLKEREGIAFLYYLKMRMEEEKHLQEKERMAANLLKDFYLRRIQEVYETTDRMLQSIARHDAIVSEFLFSDESAEDRANRNELMKRVNIDEAEFSALAVADMCSGSDKSSQEDVEALFTGNRIPPTLESKRAGVSGRVKESLSEFIEGKKEKIESMLREGLLTACHAFSHATDPLRAIHWSKQINSLLSVIVTHKTEFKDAKGFSMLQAATGMAAMGRMMENGLKALNEMCAAKTNGIQLSPEKEANLQEQVLLMGQADAKRSSEKYQKLFAKGYHPKKGPDLELLNEILKGISRCPAMRELSAMGQEEKLFVLADGESRKTMSENLFESMLEPEETAPVKEIAQPVRK